MTAQLALDFSARARRNDPQTSKDAAGRVDGVQLARRVLDALRAGGAGSSHEIADRLGMPRDSISPRMKPLEIAGAVRRAGRRDGKTIWEAC